MAKRTPKGAANQKPAARPSHAGSAGSRDTNANPPLGIYRQGEAHQLQQENLHPNLKVHFAHIRPDINPAMNGLLKESPQPGLGQLFTVFGLPRVRVEKCGTGFQPVKEQARPTEAGHGLDAHATDEYTVTMEGVDIYNPVRAEITSSGAEKVAAWFLDGDYDGRTFCVTQAFFPDRAACKKLARALNGKDGPIDAERFEAFSGTTSLPIPRGAAPLRGGEGD